MSAGAGQVGSRPHGVSAGGTLGVPPRAVGLVAGLPGLGRPLVPLGVLGDAVAEGPHPDRPGDGDEMEIRLLDLHPTCIDD